MCFDEIMNFKAHSGMNTPILLWGTALGFHVPPDRERGVGNARIEAMRRKREIEIITEQDSSWVGRGVKRLPEKVAVVRGQCRTSSAIRHVP